jgi:hypothetical protein
MDMNALSGLATRDATSRAQEQVQVQVLRKAENLQAEAAAQLVEALPQPAQVQAQVQAVEPGQPGAVVNTYA